MFTGVHCWNLVGERSSEVVASRAGEARRKQVLCLASQLVVRARAANPENQQHADPKARGKKPRGHYADGDIAGSGVWGGQVLSDSPPARSQHVAIAAKRNSNAQTSYISIRK